jgi:hypothetical protein
MAGGGPKGAGMAGGGMGGGAHGRHFDHGLRDRRMRHRTGRIYICDGGRCGRRAQHHLTAGAVVGEHLLEGAAPRTASSHGLTVPMGHPCRNLSAHPALRPLADHAA